jgi:pyrimidine operon attenuation protein / uracil phosphoribosyltransferase
MSGLHASKVIMDEIDIARVLDGISNELRSLYPDPGMLAVVGIQTGGAHLARRLVQRMGELAGSDVALGILDITLYRDDLAMEKSQPVVRMTELPFEMSGKIIVLVDDVLYTGRTVRAALDALIDFGRPRAIRLAVLIDRGLREFPIRPDFVGRSIETTPEQKVRVLLREEGETNDHVLLEMGD